MNEAIQEAQSRLSHANHAFTALMSLLDSGSDPLQPDDLYCLLQPIQGEVAAALDEINHSEGA